MSRNICFSVFLTITFVFMNGFLSLSCVNKTTELENNRKPSKESSNYKKNLYCKNTSATIESIELRRRNWENHGTDIIVYGNGKYVVTAEFLGKSKKVREGKIAPHELRDLIASIEEENVFELKDEYHAPFKTQWSWWGFHLIIKDNQGLKSVKFHSEDDNVPESLKNLVKKIQMLTR